MTESAATGLLDAFMDGCLVFGYVFLFTLLVTGCVTGGQVCVETAHGYGPGAATGLQRDTVGASACVNLERRP